jgi:hypothetical protein
LVVSDDKSILIGFAGGMLRSGKWFGKQSWRGRLSATTAKVFVHNKPVTATRKPNEVIGKIEHHPLTVLKTFVKYLWPKEAGPRLRVVVALSLLIGSKVWLRVLSIILSGFTREGIECASAVRVQEYCGPALYPG